LKKLLILIGIFALIMPLMFLGCEGDDGAPGAAGAPGDPGAPGAPGPGALANETCTLCHGVNKDYDAVAVHAAIPNGSVTVTVTDVTMEPNVGDNGVTTTVSFTFNALDAAGNDVTDEIDLSTPRSAPNQTQLNYIRFHIAKLEAGTSGNADSWFNYTESSLGSTSNRFVAGLTGGPADYTYVFQTPDNAVLQADFVDNTTHRLAIQVSGLPVATFTSELGASAPIANAIFDFVPDGGDVTLTKEVVTTTACNACHNPLSIHGSRRETQFCVVCHNPQLGDFDLVTLVHKVHTAQEVGGEDFTEVTYPQDPRNCTTCHKGGADSDNWETRPTREACGACHVEAFAAGGSHETRANSTCLGCHGPGALVPVADAHATENATPNNPQLPGTLVSFEYGITSVTVDNTNAATIKFFIKQDNVLADLGDNVITRPTNFSGGPSFLFAWALPQDGVSSPVDYNNLGRTAGQPQSVSIIGLPIVASDNASYTVTVADAFPAGAKMRAVALQGYFTQIDGGDDAVGNPIDNVGRHTPSVMLAVDTPARRTVVKSGYTGGQPVGCLECHEIFEGHGGNRVNNVQVCVMCHNPNLSSSGRTIDPATQTINPDVIAAVGNDPLLYPEATNNMKELIHGIHAATDRPYEFVRNRTSQGLTGFYYNWSEVTFPGNLADCQKCHLAGTYDADLPANVLWTTEITTDRANVPNLDDLVNSPVSSACFYCHDDGTAKSHMVLQGGKFSITREDAQTLP
jgi:OmcA/MtrC family decaheme c-type cytochrome